MRLQALPPPNPFLQLVPNRVEAALQRLRSAIWVERVPVAVTATAATASHRRFDEVVQEKRSTVQVGAAWGRLYDQRWFHVRLPDNPPAGVHLEWRDQGEATLHVAGVPFYGFDVAHRRVALPKGVRELWVEGYCCQSAIWHPDATGLSPDGSVFGGAFLLRRDDNAWAAFHDLQVLFDLMLFQRSRQTTTPPPPLERFGQQPPVDQATPEYRMLLHRLDRAIDAFDAGGVLPLRAALAGVFGELRSDASWAGAVLTGHAHLDLVWLWPERIGEAKAVHLFATANRLMALYPEFRFAYSQPASYRAVERLAPALARAVRRRIHGGQWEATGALDVESDTQLPCGEALARTFLLGQQEFRRLRGTRSRLLWLPDVFGYSGCLPQLMRLAGVEWFFTTKLTWSAINRFPYSSFVWRGTDGSEVLAHVTQNVGYNNRLELEELDANARGHTQSHLHDEFLHPTGFGDGGGGPTEEMCERARRLSGLTGLPPVRWEQPEAFFGRLARHRRELPVWQGECYLEYHRGTYTTNGELKAAFRGLERALQLREAVACATGRAPNLVGEWRRLGFAQFHDFLPGSSIPEVYADGIPELRRLEAQQQTASRNAVESASGALHVFNPLPQPWCGWVTHDDRSRWMTIPPVSGVPVTTAGQVPPVPTVDGRTLSNGRVRAELDSAGWLRALEIDGRGVALAGPSARAVLYVDRPANYDAWDVDRASLGLGRPVETPPSFHTTTARDHAAIVVTRRLADSSSLVLRYQLVAGEAVLRVDAEVDWQEKHAWLKLHFPTSYRGSQARFGAPFGSTLRSQLPGPSAVEAQWEVPASRWAAVFDEGERDGLAVITAAKYGFHVRDGELTVSLLRAPSATGLATHREAAPMALSRHRLATPYLDHGKHVIRLALARHELGAPTEHHAAALADTLFLSPMLYRGSAVTAGLLRIENAPTLVPSWAMPMKSGRWVLRLHEVSGQRGRAKVVVASGWTTQLCSLDGTKVSGRRNGPIDFGPYKIVSVRLTPPTRRKRQDQAANPVQFFAHGIRGIPE